MTMILLIIILIIVFIFRGLHIQQKYKLIFYEALYYLHYIYSNLLKNITKQESYDTTTIKRKKCIG